MKNEAEELTRVRDCIEKLSEHFDTVQIFVTRHEAGELNGTAHLAMGVGNYYARIGQVHHWLAGEDAAACRDSVSEDDGGT